MLGIFFFYDYSRLSNLHRAGSLADPISPHTKKSLVLSRFNPNFIDVSILSSIFQMSKSENLFAILNNNPVEI